MTTQDDPVRQALADCFLIFAARGRALREAQKGLTADSSSVSETLLPSAGDMPMENADAQ